MPSPPPGPAGERNGDVSADRPPMIHELSVAHRHASGSLRAGAPAERSTLNTSRLRARECRSSQLEDHHAGTARPSGGEARGPAPAARPGITAVPDDGRGGPGEVDDRTGPCSRS